MAFLAGLVGFLIICQRTDAWLFDVERAVAVVLSQPRISDPETPRPKKHNRTSPTGFQVNFIILGRVEFAVGRFSAVNEPQYCTHDTGDTCLPVT